MSYLLASCNLDPRMRIKLCLYAKNMALKTYLGKFALLLVALTNSSSVWIHSMRIETTHEY